MTKRVVILGGSGFIGTQLTKDLLTAGYAVRIGDIEPSAAYPECYQYADVRDFNSTLAVCQQQEVIINLAALHKDNVTPSKRYYETNVEGAKIVTAVATELKIQQLIFTSSAAVYGLENGQTPLDEEAPTTPFNDYGKSKLAAEKVYLTWQAQESNNILQIIRPTVVFGENNRGNVYNLFQQMARGPFIMIGNGNNKKSIAYVENVTAFIAFLLNHPEHQGIYNYVDTPDLNMRELIKTIYTELNQPNKKYYRLPYVLGITAGNIFDLLSKVLKKEFPISKVRIQKFCANSQFNNQKALATGFTPKVALNTAIKNTLAYEF